MSAPEAGGLTPEVRAFLVGLSFPIRNTDGEADAMQALVAQHIREATASLEASRDAWKRRAELLDEALTTKRRAWRRALGAAETCDLCEEPGGAERAWKWVEEGWSLACEDCLALIRQRAGASPAGAAHDGVASPSDAPRDP